MSAVLATGDEWEAIDLAWRQKLAAFWSITWPSLLAVLFVGTYLPPSWTIEDLLEHGAILSLGLNGVGFLCQALLVPRLVRKRYKSFRIDVIRTEGASERRLDAREAARVAWQVFWPQAAFYLIASLAIEFVLEGFEVGSYEEMRRIGPLSGWVRFLIVGPFAIRTALRTQYPGFRLQAFGWRYI